MGEYREWTYFGTEWKVFQAPGLEGGLEAIQNGEIAVEFDMDHGKRSTGLAFGRTIKPQETIMIAYFVFISNTILLLDLFNQDSCDEGASAIAASLKENKSLQVLCLGLNQIGEDGAAAIADALKVNTTLLCLDIGRNKIGDEGAVSVADALKSNETLQHLSLRANSIGDFGARSISDALKVNFTLRSLDLGAGWQGTNKQLGDEGAAVIAEALKENSTLQVLDLRLNKIGNDGAEAIAEALKYNSSLYTLDLSSNMIGAEGASKIADMLKVNRSLKSFRIHMNDLGIDGNVSIAACASLDVDGIDYNDARVKAILNHADEARELGLSAQQSVPLEVLNRDTPQLATNTEAYLKGLLYREDAVHQLKVLLVGPQQVGKTSLRRSLLTKGESANPTKSDDPDRATISVDVDQITFESEDGVGKGGEISLWDFGGQEEYYMTHSFFLSNRSLVMVVVDLEAYRDTDDSFEKCAGKWLRSLQMQIVRPKIVLVGTKCDTQSAAQTKEKLLSLVRRVDELGKRVRDAIAQAAKGKSIEEQEFERLRGFEGLTFTNPKSFAVSGVDVNIGDGMDSLYRFLCDLASNPDKGVALRVPKAFEDLRTMIKEKRLSSKDGVIQDLASLQRNSGFEGEDVMFRLALSLMHDLGAILWYENNEKLSELVFADPTWVVDIVRQVFRHDIFIRKEGQNRRGILYELGAPAELCRTLEEKFVLDERLLHYFPIWKDLDERMFARCVLLLQQFELMYKLSNRGEGKRQDRFMVPLFLQIGFTGIDGRELQVPGAWSGKEGFSKSLRTSLRKVRNSLSGGTWTERALEYIFFAFLPNGLLFRVIARAFPIADFTRISASSAKAAYSSANSDPVYIQMKLTEKSDGSGALSISCKVGSLDPEAVRILERTRDLLSVEVDNLLQESFPFLPYTSSVLSSESRESIQNEGFFDAPSSGRAAKSRSRKGSLYVDRNALNFSYFKEKERTVRYMLKERDRYMVKKYCIFGAEQQLEKIKEKQDADYLMRVGMDIRGKLKQYFQHTVRNLADGDPLKEEFGFFEDQHPEGDTISLHDAYIFLSLVRRLVTRLRTEYDCFMSHKWGKDGENHQKVKSIVRKLTNRGLKCWFDEAEIKDKIVSEMLDGVSESHVFVAIITEDYLKDVKKMKDRTNCGLEYDLAINSKNDDDLVFFFMDKDFADQDILLRLPKAAGKMYYCFEDHLFNRILQQLFPFDEGDDLRKTLLMKYPAIKN